MIQMRLPAFVTQAILASVLPVMESMPAQELGDDGDVYLRRWYIDRAGAPGEGNVYLHETVRSDKDPDAHDHPWDNLSIVLRGVLGEEVEHADGRRTLHERHPGEVIVRQAGERHRLIVTGRPLTLFATGPKMREWGFWEGDSWTHNNDYFAKRERILA